MMSINQVFFAGCAIIQVIWGFDTLEKLTCYALNNQWLLDNYCKASYLFTMPLLTIFALSIPLSLLNPYFILLLDISPIWAMCITLNHTHIAYLLLLTMFKAFAIFLIRKKHYHIIYYSGFHSPIFSESAEVPTYTQLFTLYGNSRIEAERNRVEFSNEDETITRDRLNSLAEYLRQEFAIRVLFNEFKKLPVRIQLN